MNFLAVGESVAIYYEVTVGQLERIRLDPKYYLDEEFVRECVNAKGNNAVITLLICRIKGTHDIRKGLKEMRSRYKSVSFWNRKHVKFRRKVCL